MSGIHLCLEDVACPYPGFFGFDTVAEQLMLYSQVVQGQADAGMLGPQCSFLTGEGPAEQGDGAFVIAAHVGDGGQVVQDVGHFGVIFTIMLEIPVEDTVKKFFGLVKFSEAQQDRGECGLVSGHRNIILTEGPHSNLYPFSCRLFGTRKIISRVRQTRNIVIDGSNMRMIRAEEFDGLGEGLAVELLGLRELPGVLADHAELITKTQDRGTVRALTLGLFQRGPQHVLGFDVAALRTEHTSQMLLDEQQ
ncbi:hypothetical protein ADK75_10790 [Streptomyces virginiae]|uniref:Uncharacterized protein n=1 Tax=Streptomyces virginiae TaxID=1961 RepID=A0A0L8MYR2_STRVG|nr:hypothetical protein ADK75_10790 [Streptomyces virginiae]